jgi:hypothetical protein
MPINQEKNLKLKEVWRIDEKFLAGEKLDADEVEFFNQNLQLIKDYYQDYAEYWSTKNPL